MLSTEHGLPDKQRVAFGRFVDGGDLRLRRGATPKIAYPVETAAAPGLAMRSGAEKLPRQKLQQQERGIIGPCRSTRTRSSDRTEAACLRNPVVASNR
jgi:hypothetical protein